MEPASDETDQRRSVAVEDPSSLGPGDANGIAYNVMLMDLGPKPAAKIETRGAKEDLLCAMLPIPAEAPQAPAPARQLAAVASPAPSPVMSPAASSSSSSSSSASSASSDAAPKPKTSPKRKRGPRGEPKQSKRRLGRAPDRTAQHESNGEVYSEVFYFEHTGGIPYATGIAHSTLRETLIQDLSTALSGEARKSVKKVCQRKTEFDSEEKRAKRFNECLARFAAQNVEAAQQRAIERIRMSSAAPTAAAAAAASESFPSSSFSAAAAFDPAAAAAAASPIMTSAPMNGEGDADGGDGGGEIGGDEVVVRTMLI